MEPVLEAIGIEIEMRQDYLGGAPVDSIYFGGGTPSLLNTNDLHRLLDLINKYHHVNEEAEITLEANPDDLNKKKTRELISAGINRLSIGAQTFNDEFLGYLNRVHTAGDIIRSFSHARDSGFNNINLDLIYAIRENSDRILEDDLRKIDELRPEHISAYCLTIEPDTVFGRWLDKGKFNAVPDEDAAIQFNRVADHLSGIGYTHYEISNFARQGWLSRHNTSYWKEESYLGAGPSAHSCNILSRQFNIANNSLYCKSLKQGKIPATLEHLSVPERVNERIMTGLRTAWGCDLAKIRRDFGVDIRKNNIGYLNELSGRNMIELDGDILKLRRKGMLFADRIASELFVSGDEP